MFGIGGLAFRAGRGAFRAASNADKARAAAKPDEPQVSAQEQRWIRSADRIEKRSAGRRHVKVSPLVPFAVAIFFIIVLIAHFTGIHL